MLVHCEPLGRLFYAVVDELDEGVDGLEDGVVGFVAAFEDPDGEPLDPVLVDVLELAVEVELEPVVVFDPVDEVEFEFVVALLPPTVVLLLPPVVLFVPPVVELLLPTDVVELDADEVVFVSVDVVLDDAVLLLIFFLNYYKFQIIYKFYFE